MERKSSLFFLVWNAYPFLKNNLYFENCLFHNCRVWENLQKIFFIDELQDFKALLCSDESLIFFDLTIFIINFINTHVVVVWYKF